MIFANELSLFQRSTLSIWTDPFISKNLLEDHLDINSDVASRNPKTIEKTIKWIEENIPPQSNILDLGCGPGLYASILSMHGHKVTGMDFNERSIQYAIKMNKKNATDITYIHGDYLNISFENKFDAIIMIYCDFGALIPSEQKYLLEKVKKHLKKDGVFIFDVFGQRFPETKKNHRSWSYSTGINFWSNNPNWLLEETKLFSENKAIGTRYIVIEDSITKEYIMWDQYYDRESISNLLMNHRFKISEIKDDMVYTNDFTSNDVLFVKCHLL